MPPATKPAASTAAPCSGPMAAQSGSPSHGCPGPLGTVPAVRVLVPAETRQGERRVAAVPDSVARLAKAGLDVVVESGAGRYAHVTDDAFTAAGATVAAHPDWAAVDVLLHVSPPTPDQAGRLRRGCVTAGFLSPSANADGIRALAAAGAPSFSLELLPRISRAQSMDALTSQALVSGYRAALVAAEHLPSFFPLLMTAAGTIPPAKVLVLGAGVAGLQAIATAKRLGAVVEAYDVRPSSA